MNDVLLQHLFFAGERSVVPIMEAHSSEAQHSTYVSSENVLMFKSDSIEKVVDFVGVGEGTRA